MILYYKLPIILIVILLPLMVAGCQLPLHTVENAIESEEEIQANIDDSGDTRQSSAPEELSYSSSRSWIGHRIPIRRSKIPEQIPDELEQIINVTYVEPVTIGEIGRLISSETNVGVTVASDIENSLISNVNWHGPADSALNHITSRLGFYWDFVDGRVEIFHTKPENWTIFAPAVTAQWQASVGLSGAVQGGIGGSTLQAQDQVVVSMDTAEFWNELESTVEGFLSDVGELSLNRQSGELNVTDTPLTLKTIDEWVSAKNKELSTQVQVHVDLYEIERSDDAIAGYNLRGLIQEAFGKTAAEIEFGDDEGSILGLRMTHSATATVDHSDIALNIRNAANGARISKLTSTVIRGINGLPVPVFFGDEISYLERRDVVSDDGLTTERLIPGKLQDGIALNMVPRVLPNTDRLMLNITVRTTRIKGIRRFPTDAGPNDPVIQLPDLESRSVLLPVLLRSGETLFVAGLDTSRVTTRDTNGILMKESSLQNRRASLVLILTPYIIRLPYELARGSLSRAG